MNARTISTLPTSLCNKFHLDCRILKVCTSSYSFKAKEQQRNTGKRINKKYALKNLEILENEILFGRSVCNIALKASRRPLFRFHMLKMWQNSEADDTRVVETMQLAEERNIPIVYSSRSYLDKLASFRPHQGVCLEAGELPFTDFDDTSCEHELKTLGELKLTRPPLWVLLYGILDPMNLGAILRSCLYFDVNKVLVAGNCAPMTPIVSKASSGAAEILQIHAIDNPCMIVQLLCKHNWDVVGTVAERSYSCRNMNGSTEDIADFETDKPSLVIFGSEGFGIPAELVEHCTRLVTIQPPTAVNATHSLAHLVGSLNVSTATAIILHGLQKKRQTLQS